jgi:hypothetical protein
VRGSASQTVGVGREEGGVNFGQAAVHVAHHHVAVGDPVAPAPDRIEIHPGDDLVDASGQLAAVHHPPPGHHHREALIHQRHDVVVVDQPGPEHAGAEGGWPPVWG